MVVFVLIEINVTFWVIFIYTLCIIFGAIIMGLIEIIVMTLSFFYKGMFSIAYTLFTLTEYTKYPLEIFPVFIRVILVYVIPFYYAVYYPVTSIIRGDFTNILLSQIIVLAILFLLAFITWKKGVSNYESSGH
jgi:ABC-2 type transport system permease protein